MSTAVQDAVLQLLPSRRRKSTNGWTSFDAVCCHHSGETTDTRGRGGLYTSNDGGFSYNCFNCNFKVSYRPGWLLGYKLQRWLAWLGADENTIQRLIIEALRIKDQVNFIEQPDKTQIKFEPRPMPHAVKLLDSQHQQAWKYCQDRMINLKKYPMLVSDSVSHNLNRRVIIPFTWQEQLIGYSARAWDPMVKPKYHSQFSSGYVYNMDQQHPRAQFVIVVEGPIDAISIDAVAVLGNSCSDTQAEIIENLNREIIVVPDNDKSGHKLIDFAKDRGWSVSFPVWFETCKDVNEAVIKYGKLFVLKTILNYKIHGNLKIELRQKLLYNNT